MAGFMHSLNIISRCTQMQRTQKLKSLGLCGGQVPYLHKLYRNPGMTQEELSKSLYFQKSSVSRAISNLEKLGFVERRPCEADRRCLRIYPTQKTADVMPLIQSVMTEWKSYLLEDLTDDERETLAAIMTHVSERAQSYIQREEAWDE